MPSIDKPPFRKDPRLKSNLIEALHKTYQDAGLYQTYYGHRMTDYQRRNTAYEIALAIGTSGAIAAWPIWQNGVGQSMWAIFAGSIAILVILKPFLQFSNKIERYSKLYASWGELYYILQSLLNEHKVVSLSEERLLKSFKDANGRISQLQKDKDPQLIGKLIQKSRTAVDLEIIPLSSLPMPISEPIINPDVVATLSREED